jgi:Fe-S cluster biogenesis protein NfuA
VPFLSKATGYSLADIATEVILGKTLKEQGIFDLYPEEKKRFYVKVPVFSFNKIKGLDTYLSPEMKSTGEAIGYDNKLNRALHKALTASGTKLRNYGTVFATLAGDDKAEALPLVRRVMKIQEIIDKEIKPLLEQDGGSIELIDIKGNTIVVRLQGRCAGCPAAGATLKHTVEDKLREFVSPGLEVVCP